MNPTILDICSYQFGLTRTSFLAFSSCLRQTQISSAGVQAYRWSPPCILYFVPTVHNFPWRKYIAYLLTKPFGHGEGESGKRPDFVFDKILRLQRRVRLPIFLRLFI